MSAISNPYFSDIICAIETECARLGMMVFLSDTQDDPDRELAVVIALHQRRVDGIILAPSAIRSGVRLPISARLDCLACSSIARPTPRSIRSASTIARRCRRWSNMSRASGIGASAMSADIRACRRPGARRRLSRQPRAPRPDVRRALSRHRERLDEFGDERDPYAAVARTAADRDRRRQQSRDDRGDAGRPRARIAGSADISLVGFDDFEWADCFEPRLTLVAQPCEEIGRRAAILLMERIAAPDGPRRSLRLDARLIMRDSCARPQ